MDSDSRPWGTFVVLDDGPGYKVKRLTVLPEKRTSLQSHDHRAEIWTVISGYGWAVLEDLGSPEPKTESVRLYCGKQLVIPPKSRHRIESSSREDLVILELQLGICNEDDITRYEDDYGRLSAEPVAP